MLSKSAKRGTYQLQIESLEKRELLSAAGISFDPLAGTVQIERSIKNDIANDVLDGNGNLVPNQTILDLPISEADVPGMLGARVSCPQREIYWSAATGSHIVYDVIRDNWQSAAASFLGLPLTDESEAPETSNPILAPCLKVSRDHQTGIICIFGPVLQKMADILSDSSLPAR